MRPRKFPAAVRAARLTARASRPPTLSVNQHSFLYYSSRFSSAAFLFTIFESMMICSSKSVPTRRAYQTCFRTISLVHQPLRLAKNSNYQTMRMLAQVNRILYHIYYPNQNGFIKSSSIPLEFCLPSSQGLKS
ncbi:hypothetical protein BO83DRAFT_196839 [Aspergillus eucalypticola CBS 122712]|uniref:Uncharacterized protein n=1 Tax=Aspergillus eucalypticola (strain CBS 122712 / IBT 29274) TaxID=1448314 RepID=A0A317W1J0_ASPEC|nr:uncharacterized protein BO83DRAFT_196839 [Aspergillus eucalypticola CBS 122712]PWY79845.1 hypothetical protein BO83DRAFT_196839 [Aspergillus eucalypticola CBS 122712]